MSEQMPRKRLEKEIRAFLKTRKILVLCTCDNNIPRATPMDFYMEKGEDNYNLYVGLSPGRKIENIKNNPIVSIGIYTPMETGKIQGMQITATGEERLKFLKDGEEGFEKAQRIVRGKRKLILRILPEKIELLDYDFVKENYSRFQILEL
ncbi:MAG: putative Pyridoxamine 5'-phosphate oxidase-related FMN-binding [Promethearchaeota archaeon]|jgi:putative heme iron utilization protein|nr:MAG: putative Pyridoxamine 5'-phosphate oxidase-related FMN-binding [Candidatus Lokiarchaeota archaeon]